MPTDGQVAAFAFLLEQQEQIKDAILESLLPHYLDSRRDYKAFLGSEFKELMPKLSGPAGFRELLQLSGVFVHRREENGIAHIGIRLQSSWEREHGLGFLMHRTKVIGFGGWDTAC
jgi:hypothetical protein